MCGTDTRHPPRLYNTLTLNILSSELFLFSFFFRYVFTKMKRFSWERESENATYEGEVAGGDAEAHGQLAGEALLGQREHGLHQDVGDEGLDDEALP